MWLAGTETREDRVRRGVQGGREGGVWWVGAWLPISVVTYKGMGWSGVPLRREVEGWDPGRKGG